jgi:predicted alpha/beta superfamily hydrolase
VGDDFEIFVARPPAIMGALPETLPVLYGPDANLGFESCAQMASSLLADLIAPVQPVLYVGVGYPVEDDVMEVARIRCRDLTSPGTEPHEGLVQAYGGDVAFGGADKFLRFLESELDPIIRENYACDPGPAGLFGHSYGGLFALYALFNRSPLFDRYIIGSPGALTDDDPIWGIEAACHEASQTLDARVYLGLGELEEGHEAFYALLGRAYRRLVELLEKREYEGLEWSAAVHEGGTHMSVSTDILARGLRALYPGAPIPGLS